MGVVDWQDETQKRLYTQQALQHTYGIACTIEPDRLCPTIPNRLNYIQWITRIVEAMPYTQRVVGIDVGTGHLAIYAALICMIHPTWHMIGTDVDVDALMSAQHMIDTNEATHAWRHRLQLVHTDRSTVLPPLPENEMYFYFTICNPPFYDSHEERLALQHGKNTPYPPSAARDTELYTPGGDLGFVIRMINESAQPSYRHRVAWFSSMLGRLSSVQAVVAHLKQRNDVQYALTELVQGRTWRWVVAWSFGPHRLPDEVAQCVGTSLRTSLPPSNTRRWADIPWREPAELAWHLRAIDTLPSDAVAWTDVPLTLTVWTVCWTRGARRARQRAADSLTLPTTTTAKPHEPLLRVAWYIQEDHVEARWVYGTDRVLFDSLCTHIHGQLQSQLAPSAVKRPRLRH